MNKLFCLLVLLVAHQAFAGNIFSLVQPPQQHPNSQAQDEAESATQNDQSDQDAQSNEESDTFKTTCNKCNKSAPPTIELVEYCYHCHATICSRCEFKLLLDSPLFLDKTQDFFFVKSRCFKCNKSVLTYGYSWKHDRQAILMDRAKDEAYKEIRRKIP